MYFTFKETRSCFDAPMCPPKCPDIYVVEMRTQSNNPLSLEVVYNMDKVEFIPFGELEYQEIKLELPNQHIENDIPNKITWKKNEFKKDGLSTNNTVHNLLKEATYKTTVKVYMTLKMENEYGDNSKISKLVHECSRKV